MSGRERLSKGGFVQVSFAKNVRMWYKNCNNKSFLFIMSLLLHKLKQLQNSRVIQPICMVSNIIEATCSLKKHVDAMECFNCCKVLIGCCYFFPFLIMFQYTYFVFNILHYILQNHDILYLSFTHILGILFCISMHFSIA